MENASKALIIAGAILISIVLITLGVAILGQGQEVVNSSNIDDVQVQQFNSKFSQYCGDKVSGANVNALLNAIISNNIIAQRDGEDDKIIKVKVNDSGIQIAAGTATASDTNDCAITKILKKAQTGKVYKVTVRTYNGNTGYISVIDLKKV